MERTPGYSFRDYGLMRGARSLARCMQVISCRCEPEFLFESVHTLHTFISHAVSVLPRVSLCFRCFESGVAWRGLDAAGDGAALRAPQSGL